MDLTFDEVLEAVDKLPVEQKEILVDLVKNRQIQHRRRELLNDVEFGRKEYANGMMRKGSSSELMKEILK